MGCLSLKKALIALFSSENGLDMAAQYLRVEYDNDENGNPNFMSPNLIQPIDLNEFLNLPCRDFDIPVSTTQKNVRAPVLILSRSKKIVMKKLRPSIENLYHLYGGKCVWTGKVLSKNAASKEHLVPQSIKKDDSFKNVVLADKRLNSERGNTLLKDWKYKMQYQPKEPLPMPWAATIKHIPREEWKYFLFNK